VVQVKLAIRAKFVAEGEELRDCALVRCRGTFDLVKVEHCQEFT
jgi:hypothetical protein